MKLFLRKPYLLLIVYFLIICVFYYPSHESKFVNDYLYWASKYSNQGLGGWLNSYGDLSIKLCYHTIMGLGYYLFGWNSWAWHLFTSTVHAGNAFLLFLFIRDLFARLNIGLSKDGGYLALSASFLFLISPFVTEAVVWAAAIHFMAVTSFILIALRQALFYYYNPKIKYLFWILLLFTIGYTATEMVLALPVLVVILYLVLEKNNSNNVWKGITKSLPIIISTFIILVSFVLLNSTIFGSITGHYGDQTHLNFDWQYIGANLMKYNFSHFSFFRFWPVNQWEWVKYLEGSFAAILYGCLIMTVTALFLFSKKANTTILAIAFYLMYNICLLPVMNLENNTWYGVMNERYNYAASVFFYCFITILIFVIFRKWKLYVIALVAVLNSIGLTISMRLWKTNGEIFQNLANTFPYYHQGNVYILSFFDHLKGAYLFRQGFRQLMEFKYQDSFKATVVEVASLNAKDPNDSVKVSFLGNDSLKVEIAEWGRWFNFHKGSKDSTIQFSQFENIMYTIDPPKNGNDLFLYQAGDRWTIVDVKEKAIYPLQKAN